MHASAPASSTSFMIQPPCTFPWLFACSGCISCASVMREACTGLGLDAVSAFMFICPSAAWAGTSQGNLPSFASIQIRPQLPNIECVQPLRLVLQDIDKRFCQFPHEGGERNTCRRKAPPGRGWRREGRAGGLGSPPAENARLLRDVPGVEAEHGEDLSFRRYPADPLAAA